jgi:hypothetical protein
MISDPARVDMLNVQEEGQLTYYYYFFDQKRPLQLDTTRIALCRDAPAEKEDLQSIVMSPSEEKLLSVAGWSIVPAPVMDQDQKGIHNLVTLVADRTNYRFVSPVFTASDGGTLIVTPSILVGFDPEIGSMRDHEVLLESPDWTIVDHNWADMDRVYRLQCVSNNGFQVLAAANALAELPEVRFAEPDFIFTGQGSFIPNDTGFSKCWGIHNIGQIYRSGRPAGTFDMDMDGPEAWDITTADFLGGCCH